MVRSRCDAIAALSFSISVSFGHKIRMEPSRRTNKQARVLLAFFKMIAQGKRMGEEKG